MIEYDIMAGQPIIYLVTPEESRAEAELIRIAKENKQPIWFWSETEGFISGTDKAKKQVEDPIEALSTAQKMEEGTIVVFRDLHSYFNTQAGTKIRRMLRDIARDFKQSSRTLVLLSSVQTIPAELEREITVAEFDLPDEAVLQSVWDAVYKENKDSLKKYKIDISEDEQNLIITGARGLTTIEAETAFAKAIVERCKKYAEDKDPPAISKLVLKEKAAAVKRSGILEYFEPNTSGKDIGGLADLKAWLQIRKGVFSKRAKEFGLPNPKGILLVGLPGCGKSLTAKAASNILGVPLIRFDISRVFAGLVGMSEQNCRSALKQIDSIGNCVVWIDEMEKAFAGMGGSGSTDSGVSKRIFGMIITWLQEKKGASFIVATVNNIDNLPPELLRKGRFDEIFYVGLPSTAERRQILDIAIRKYGRDPSTMKASVLDKTASEAKRFSGAELDEAVVSGLYYAFSKNKELEADHIWGACQATVPLAVSRANQLKEMESWAKANAVPASSESDDDEAGRKDYVRKLRLA